MRTGHGESFSFIFLSSFAGRLDPLVKSLSLILSFLAAGILRMWAQSLFIDLRTPVAPLLSFRDPLQSLSLLLTLPESYSRFALYFSPFLGKGLSKRWGTPRPVGTVAGTRAEELRFRNLLVPTGAIIGWIRYMRGYNLNTHLSNKILALNVGAV